MLRCLRRWPVGLANCRCRGFVLLRPPSRTAATTPLSPWSPSGAWVLTRPQPPRSFTRLHLSTPAGAASDRDRTCRRLFPAPLQSHLNCMLHFATGLVAAGVHVTFLHTDHNLRRIDPSAGAPTTPRLRFLSVPDGLPDDHPRSVDGISELMESLWTEASVAYRALLAKLCAPRVSDNDAVDDGFPPVTCVVADGIMPFAIDIAEELGVPAIAFRTASACSFLAYLSVPRLVELGELPFPDGADLDEPVRGVPGMESFLRLRDLPVQCRSFTNTHQDPLLRMVVESSAHSRKARALVFNTAPSLERSALEHIKPQMRDVFTIGPLHAACPAPAAASSLLRTDDGILPWLDTQADRSVVYVSLGSLAVISDEQFTEFLSGLVAAGHPFLWVLRPDMAGASQDAALREAIATVREDKARVVAWAPQRDVLRHRAVGWNSTLEAAVEGMPMVCWPFFADQQVNSRFVGAVWRTGLDMKDVCDRAVVQKMVREAMESGEIRASAQGLADQVRNDIAGEGSSAKEFRRLVQFIKELSIKNE
ncbi:hypothetical protein ACP4OV_007303 [Aristida adscensionis]